MDRTLSARIKIRRDTASNWSLYNPVLLSGELGIETDTLKIKMGDGVLPWGSLSYLETGGGETSSGGSIVVNLTLLANAWNDRSYTIHQTSIQAYSPGDLSLSQSATEEQYEAWARCLPQVTAQSAGSITLTAWGEVPQIDIPVSLEIRDIADSAENPITPESIGASPAIHANQHSLTGTDPISPDDIGASNKPKSTQMILLASSWSSGTYQLLSPIISSFAFGRVSISQSATEAQYEAWAKCLPQVTMQTSGSITLTARGTVPIIDIPIDLEVII